MIVFAIETVTRRGSLALAADREPAAAALGDDASTHGERLPLAAVHWLAGRGLGLADIDHFAVVVGPGSFTGLRVGIATVQGWASASAKMVVPISTFDALLDGWLTGIAPGSADEAVVAACVDGQRGEVFVSVAEVHAARHVDDMRRLGEPFAATPTEAAARVAESAGGRPVVFVGGGAERYAGVLRAALRHSRVDDVTTPLAASAARLAWHAPTRAVSPHRLRPIYVRRPDAEIALERRRAKDAAVAAAAAQVDATAGAAAAIAAPPIASPATSDPVAALTVRRAAGADDLAAVEALQRQTFTNPWGADAIRWELEHTDVARLYLLSGADGALVGYCACWIVFDELHINSLAIDEAWRRRGAARRLLEAIFAQVTDDGARSATLEVRASNQAALRLYEGLGFKVEGTRRDYYQSPREDALILWNRHLAGPMRAAD